MTATAVRASTRQRTPTATIDCDIHNNLPSKDALFPYLSETWRRYAERFGLRNSRYSGAYYPRVYQNAARVDSWPPNGNPPGSELPFLQEQLLDEWDLSYGVLNPLIDEGAPNQQHSAYAAAIATAVNEWQAREWLEPEPRLRASLVVPYEDADLAVAEIERWADDPRFVQILFLARTKEPLGRPKYWKIYEVAAHHGLPIGIHFGGAGGNAITGAGWPGFYLEDHVGMPQTFQAQIASYVMEGVFERFPALKVVVIEGGMAWLPSLMWRMDRAWKQLHDEVPHLTRAPSAYVRENIWLTTQPMEEPPQRQQFHQLLDQLGMDDKLMFATDYPHWDFDSPDQALPARLAPELERKIMSGNAEALYRF